jgi:hypothetical protein
VMATKKKERHWALKLKPGDRVACTFPHKDRPWVATVVCVIDRGSTAPLVRIQDRERCDLCGCTPYSPMRGELDAAWFIEGKQ